MGLGLSELKTLHRSYPSFLLMESSHLLMYLGMQARVMYWGAQHECARPAQYWIPDITMNLPFHFSVSVNYHSDHGKVQAESLA